MALHLPMVAVVLEHWTLDMGGWDPVLALPLTSCVALSKSLSLSEPRLPRLEKGRWEYLPHRTAGRLRGSKPWSPQCYM